MNSKLLIYRVAKLLGLELVTTSGKPHLRGVIQNELVDIAVRETVGGDGQPRFEAIGQYAYLYGNRRDVMSRQLPRSNRITFAFDAKPETVAARIASMLVPNIKTNTREVERRLAELSAEPEDEDTVGALEHLLTAYHDGGTARANAERTRVTYRSGSVIAEFDVAVGRVNISGLNDVESMSEIADVLVEIARKNDRKA